MIGRMHHRHAEANLAFDSGYSRMPSFADRLRESVRRGLSALLADQHQDAYWCYELEADCTIPAEYILMCHFMDEIDEALEEKIAVYLRARQDEHGGWPLYRGGGFDLSCSVKVYYALKMVGDDPGAPHMVRAREAILAAGGAARANVFTRITLALFGQIPWRGTPFLPVEIMLLPRWFPFHVSKVSYWSRTVMIPLSILCSLRAQADNPRGIHIRELFTTPPEQERDYFPVRSKLNRVFLAVERTGKRMESLIPQWVRRRALARAERWFTERLSGVDGLGAIFPAMVNAHKALALLGYPEDHPYRIATRDALRGLLVIGEDYAYCQPCVSPIWDTALACCAIHEATDRLRGTEVIEALDWLAERQLLDEPGDWRESRPELRGGGWPFQFGNAHYPDLDDTAAVAWAMLDVDPRRYREPIERAAEWVAGMQSSNGGFAAFDVDNTYHYLNEIPFADHGALLDPPTADVTARCMILFAKHDRDNWAREIQAAIDFLRREQEQEGCWFGRWGTNYIYGTWSVLAALEIVGESPDQPYIRRAVDWLVRVQNPDGGWGEDNHSYHDPEWAGRGYASTSFQTAWALLSLMAAGQTHTLAVRRGIEFLHGTQRADGLWHDEEFTAPGFPRVFYLKYHGYTKYFPLWALARYENLQKA